MPSPAWVEALGDVAGFCTTFAFVPQLAKIYKQGGRDLSYGMLSLYLFGVLLWLGYGVLVHAQAVVLANSATAILIAAATLLKAWRERQETIKPMVPRATHRRRLSFLVLVVRSPRNRLARICLAHNGLGTFACDPMFRLGLAVYSCKSWEITVRTQSIDSLHLQNF
jgi:MtN3 and saliva related transmembrane protein